MRNVGRCRSSHLSCRDAGSVSSNSVVSPSDRRNRTPAWPVGSELAAMAKRRERGSEGARVKVFGEDSGKMSAGRVSCPRVTFAAR
ncbi:MAG: hypothetical protein ACRD1X_13915 [Vicinamibacteria bacterium]